MSANTHQAVQKLKLSEGWRQVLEFVLPLAVVGILWELVVRLGLTSLTTLPAPSEILARLWELSWGSGVIFRHLGRSLYRLTVGYLLAAVIGIGLGAVLASRRALRDMFSPLLSLLISVPTIAWVPPLLITMGLGDRTVISAIFLGGIFAITYNTIRGIEMVNKSLVDAARIMGATPIKLFGTVLIPASLVSILTGLRLGIGYSWRALVGGEMLSAMVEWGIGKMIYQARFWNDVAAMFVGLLIIAFSAFLLDRFLLQWLERVTVQKWGMLTKR